MLIGKTCSLRPLEFEDLEILRKWSNDPTITSMLGGWHHPISRLEHENWFKANVNDFLNRRFAIDVDGIIRGTANLVQINWKDRNAVHGAMIGDEAFRGKGIGPEVIDLIMGYSFLELGLNRLDSDVISTNVRSLHVYTKKCGWEIVGRQKEWYFRDNKWHDRVLIGITRNEFLSRIGG
jgi:RimJ/RimL family protein N-acetyltransferase